MKKKRLYWILLGLFFAFTVWAQEPSKDKLSTKSAVGHSKKASRPNYRKTRPARAPTSEKPTSEDRLKRWTFDEDPENMPPKGFEFGLTGRGRKGRWVVQQDPTAPSKRNVLLQADQDRTDFRFPIAVAAGERHRDMRESVLCKMISGKVDQACGMVLRYQNQDNYYVTRANALENNIRLYIVNKGKRKQLASFQSEIKSGIWYALQFEARGETLKVYWNGAPVLEKKDSRIKTPGRCGL